jgi:23S rRNA (adenine-N6)-dimethyltransferase
VRAASARPWGWHRLTDTWAARLVAGAQVRPGDVVLDVGAGAGAITAALVASGARVIAVELHPARLQVLRERFAGAPVTVVRADVTDLRLPRAPFRVVANPPFATTTALLRRLLGPGSRLVAADLVMPRHDVARWAAGRAPGAGRWQRTFAVTAGRTLPHHAFVPVTPVATRTLVVRRRV